MVRFEIVGLDQETKDRWKLLANTLKRLRNCYWRSWLVAHTQAGSVERTQQYLADLKAWYEAGSTGEAPKREVECLTPEITKTIEQAIKRHYAKVNDRCVYLAMQILGKEMFTRKSSKGNQPRWVRILADDGEFPSSSSPQPIPFDRRNGTILVPTSDDGEFQLRLHVDRIERLDKKYATSSRDVFTLKTRGGNLAEQRAILWKIAKGDEYEFAGSNLVYQESKDKWFAHICYQKQKVAKPELDPNRVAFLRPAKQRPWWLRIEGYHHYIGGRTGKYVAHVREQLLTNRWSRQEAYQYASSARRGHGRDRAVGRVYLLKNRWKDFVKTANQRIVHDVIAKCVEKSCGRLVFYQPIGPVRENRFLHLAGKVPGRTDSTGWDWSQVQRLLSSKCDELGIKFDVRKVGERKAVFR